MRDLSSCVVLLDRYLSSKSKLAAAEPVRAANCPELPPREGLGSASGAVAAFGAFAQLLIVPLQMLKAIIQTKPWKHAETLAASFAVLLAVPAFVLSWLSYSTSQTALDLAKADFDASRSLVLVGEVIRERDALRITPQLSEMRLQSATYLFPPTLQLKTTNPFDSGFEIPLAPLSESLGVYAASLPKPSPDSALVAPGRLLPMIVEAHYLAKGRLMFGRYLCNVTFSFKIRGDDKPPEVLIDGLVFVGSIADAKTPTLDQRLEDSFRGLRP